jgi:hypothetical protein
MSKQILPVQLNERKRGRALPQVALAVSKRDRAPGLTSGRLAPLGGNGAMNRRVPKRMPATEKEAETSASMPKSDLPPHRGR